MSLSLWKAINGAHTLLGNVQNLPCVDGMQWRFIVRNGLLIARHDPWRGNTIEVNDSSIGSGLAGVGVRNSHADNGINAASFYYIDTQAPALRRK